MTTVRIATFNLNNLFNRYNFQGVVAGTADPTDTVTGSVEYHFDDPANFRLRTFLGNLVKEKPAAERVILADRLIAIDADVVCVQEVEDIETLRMFATNHLQGRYPYLSLLEGNDPRLIDVAVMSRLPLGAVTSWQHARHPADPGANVFSRDLLEVEVLSPDRSRRLVTVYNNHLKSKFVPFDQDPVAGAAAADLRRTQQAETVARIVEARQRPNGRFVIVGDMNDAPTAPTLAALAGGSLGLVAGLANPRESRPSPAENPMPVSVAWTSRFKKAGQPAVHELFDQIWLSPALAARQQDAVIHRRTKLGGDASDHDPASVDLDL
jgi:endonuclease/exonuclease/phosphatase family metal-dependent hydrolase